MQAILVGLVGAILGAGLAAIPGARLSRRVQTEALALQARERELDAREAKVREREQAAEAKDDELTELAAAVCQARFTFDTQDLDVVNLADRIVDTPPEQRARFS